MSAAVAVAVASRLSGVTAVSSLRDADVTPGALSVFVTPLPSPGSAPTAVDVRRAAVQVLGRRDVGTALAPASGLPWAAVESLVEQMRRRAERLDGRPVAVVTDGQRHVVMGVAVVNVGARRPYEAMSWAAIDLEITYLWNPALSAPAAVVAGSPGTTP